MGKFFLYIVLIGCLVLPSATVSAKTIRLATLDFKPFIWCENDEVKGIYFKLINELFSRANQPYTISCYPWKRALYHLKVGNVDGLFAAFKTEEREQFAVFVETPLRKAAYYTVTRSDSLLELHTTDDLRGLRVGINLGHSVSPEFDLAAKRGDIYVEEASSLEQNLRKLISGRIDVYVNDKTVVLDGANRLNILDQIKVHSDPISKTNPSYLLLSKATDTENMPSLVRELNAKLSEMWDDGTVDRIYASVIDE
ncbi:substrate-binding periplasmic protein [Vibrio sp. HN007]|uniref:substrate-binding periplasmic protein n=1 Tax=Vibrio iocasae TaxID=3098914 RepID=UPI0035D413D0